MGESSSSIAIFNSYVKLPEGMYVHLHIQIYIYIHMVTPPHQGLPRFFGGGICS